MKLNARIAVSVAMVAVTGLVTHAQLAAPDVSKTANPELVGSLAAALLVVAVLGARWLIGLLRMPSWRRPVSIAVTAAAAIALTAVTIARHDDFYDRLQFW